MPQRRRAAGAGTVRQLGSGRWQARFRGPDGVLRPASVTFDTKLDAGAWLKAQGADVDRGLWSAPDENRTSTRLQTLNDYAATWLDARELKPRTRHDYMALIAATMRDSIGEAPLDRITPTTVRNWYATLDPATPTKRAHAYSLLRAMFTTAVADEVVSANPCRIRGAGGVRSKHDTKVASLGELEVIVAHLPDRYRPMILLAAWCGLRFGELAELRRGDIDLEAGLLRVQRGVTRTGGDVHVGDPKSRAGIRAVSIPPHLLPVLEGHLSRHVGAAGEALLFPARGGQHMAPSSLYRVWYPAREAAGRPDLSFHDLRHTGATLAAATGATLADLMARLGHSTPGAALRYQHAVQDRDKAIAAALSGFAEAKVIPLRSRTVGA